jgi:hypothetical protein
VGRYRLTTKGKAFLAILFFYIIPMILVLIAGIHANGYW